MSSTRLPLSFTFLLLSIFSQNQNANTLSNYENGLSDFKNLITNKKNAYVDKTLFIEEVMRPDKDIILITRPPGFGKTLALSTLDYFLSDQHEGSQLFSGSDIMKKTPHLNEMRNAHMGKHPVIRLDLSNVRGLTYRESYNAIQDIVSKEFLRHSYAVNGKQLLTQAFDAVVNKTTNEERFASSINWLSTWVSSYHNKTGNVIILIDGYDTPIVTGYMRNYYEEIVGFMRRILQETLDRNPCIFKAVVTAVMPVSGEMQTKRMQVDTVFGRKYSQLFGFTREELQKLIQKVHKGAAMQKRSLQRVEAMFSGYSFADVQMFNPRAVMQYLLEDKVGGSFDPTSKHYLGKLLMGYGMYPTFIVQQLLAGVNVTKEVCECLCLPDIENNEKNYWTFLLHFGYLTGSTEFSGTGEFRVSLRVPNLEVHTEIAKTLQTKRSGLISLRVPDYKRFMEDLAKNNLPRARATLDYYLQNAGSYLNRPGKGFDDKHLERFFVQIARGLEDRFNLTVSLSRKGKTFPSDKSTNPEIYDGEVCVSIQAFEMNIFGIIFYKIRDLVCPLAKDLKKNETAILVLCCENRILTCLGPR